MDVGSHLVTPPSCVAFTCYYVLNAVGCLRGSHEWMRCYSQARLISSPALRVQRDRSHHRHCNRQEANSRTPWACTTFEIDVCGQDPCMHSTADDQPMTQPDPSLPLGVLPCWAWQLRQLIGASASLSRRLVHLSHVLPVFHEAVRK
jgi:hypothetical protein